MKCPKCGRDNPGLTVTCESCGASLYQAAQQASQQPPVVPQPVAPPQVTRPTSRPVITSGAPPAPKVEKSKTPYIITGVIIGVLLLVAVLLYPMLRRGQQRGMMETCEANQKKILTSLAIYQQEHQDTLPEYHTFWSDINSSPFAYKCPADSEPPSHSKSHASYGTNTAILGLAIRDIVDVKTNTPADLHQVFIIADTKTNDFSIWKREDFGYRHQGFAMVGYLDGHIGLKSSDPNDRRTRVTL